MGSLDEMSAREARELMSYPSDPLKPGEPDCAGAESPLTGGIPDVPVVGHARNDARYRSLFENNLDAVFSLDREGRFVEANPAAERLSGYSQRELRTMDLAELCTVEDRHKSMFFFARAMAGAPRSAELSAICKDGCVVDLSVTGVPIVTD